MDKIRVALGGSEGRMGKVLQRLASDTEDIEIVCRIDHVSPEYREVGDIIGKPILSSIDIYADFTSPDSVVDNIRKISKAGIDSVVGTTGWYDRCDEVRDVAIEYSRRILYAPNFSPLVNVQREIVKDAARLLRPMGYDIGIVEEHHTGKKDSPSGTANTMAADIMEVTGLTKKVYRQEGIHPKDSGELDMASLRLGGTPGEHDVRMVGLGGKLSITTIMYSREDFGLGALAGIRWLFKNKNKEPGLYAFKEDVLGLS